MAGGVRVKSHPLKGLICRRGKHWEMSGPFHTQREPAIEDTSGLEGGWQMGAFIFLVLYVVGGISGEISSSHGGRRLAFCF